MKKLIALSLCLVSASPALAEESHTLWNGTGTGSIHVPGAEIKVKHGAATAWGSYLSQGSLVGQGDSVTRSRYGAAVQLAPFELLELGVAASGSGVSNSLGTPQDMTVFGDMTLAAKSAMAVLPWLATGVRGELRLYSGISGSSGYGDTASYAGQWVSTARRGALAGHMVVGYIYDRTVNFVQRTPTPVERFAWNQIDFNQVQYGAAVNYETAFADYIVEISGEKPVGDGAPAFNAGLLRVTPGLRFRPLGPVEITLGADIALADEPAAGIPAQPKLDVLSALRWTFDFKPVVVADSEPAPAPAPEAEPVAAVQVVPVAASLGAVTGRVVNLANGSPMAGVRLQIAPYGLVATSSATGNYIFSDVPAGAISITAGGDGFTVATMESEVKAGGLITVDLGLKTAPTTGLLALTVLDAESKPVADADVLLDGSTMGKTSSEGRFEAPDVRAGAHELVFQKAGYKKAEPVTILMVAGQTVMQTGTLQREPRPGFVEVKAFNEDRQAVAGMVTIEGSPDLQRPLDPAAGSSTTYKLQPGVYRIRVEASGYIPEVQEVTVPEDGELALRFKLRK